MRQFRISTLYLITFLFTLTAFSQEQSNINDIGLRQNQFGGTLSGRIVDQKSGEDIIGANIFIIDTKLGASTDIDGKFLIKKIPEGVYTVRISYLGYETKNISNVIISPDESISLNIGMGEDQGIQQQEVVISASAIKSGEGAILAERRKAASIGDGISSEQMKKAPDATSGDALKRVTGVSIVDNKFVFVRGVTDRYNQTTLNGASVTSTSVDKKSFSFDMLPSNLLENMNVTKTATPDLPGDFTGGLVQLNTLDFPESRLMKLVYSGSYNSMTTYKNFQRSQGGNQDWIGTDDGIRELPNGAHNGSLAQILPNTWSHRNSKAPMNQSLSISIGDRFDIGEDQIGIIAALSYRNNYQRTEFNIHDYSGGFETRDLRGTSDRYSILWGGILDVNYKFANEHKISFKNNYNRSAEDKSAESYGQNFRDDQYVRVYQTEWEQRGMYSGQLAGEHQLSDMFDVHADWLAFYSTADTKQPDRKKLEYTLSRGYPESDPFAAEPGERAWASLLDNSGGFKMNFALPIDNAKIKWGASYEEKKRSYGIRYYQIQLESNPSPASYAYVYYAPDSIYQKENFGPGKFTMNEVSKPSDKYSAEQVLFAYYAMSDLPFAIDGLNFRFVGGARIENSVQNVFTSQGRTSADPFTATINKADILPSANLTYLITESQNLRFAYSQTVNRPEFRELANVYFYDFDRYEYVYGNPNLQRALAHNYDIRYEYFPEASDLFAVSYFRKSIKNAIEEKRTTFGAFPERTWVNADNAKNFGWEFEMRKNLRFISPSLEHIQIIANYTRIFSTVPFRTEIGNSTESIIYEQTRPMQGQSPYMVNVSLFFTEPGWGTSINVLFNEYGSRIDAISDVRTGDGDIYEHKRGTFDLSFTQSLALLIHGLEAKYAVKNLTSRDVLYTQDGLEYRRNKIGATHSLQLSFNF